MKRITGQVKAANIGWPGYVFPAEDDQEILDDQESGIRSKYDVAKDGQMSRGQKRTNDVLEMGNRSDKGETKPRSWWDPEELNGENSEDFWELQEEEDASQTSSNPEWTETRDLDLVDVDEEDSMSTDEGQSEDPWPETWVDWDDVFDP